MGRKSRQAARGVRIKLIALLCWYDESPTWLAQTVASLSKAHVSHVVAVDGAYSLYPGANDRPASNAEQAEAILETARGIGIGCTIHVPTVPWAGNEVEKRSFLFRAGNLVAEPFTDWFLVIDADEVVMSAPLDLLDRLGWSRQHAAAVTLVTPHDAHKTEAKSRAVRDVSWGTTEQLAVPLLFRAFPSLRVGGVHDLYIAEDKNAEAIYLRGNVDQSRAISEFGHKLEPVGCEDIPEFKIEHRTDFRDKARADAARSYYGLRDRLGVEDMKPVLA